jgi:hypothetical protein
MTKEITNLDRAERARNALQHYARLMGDDTIVDVGNHDYEAAMQDLITDFLHLQQQHSTDDQPPLNDETYIALCCRALGNYEEETGHPIS